MVGPKGSLSVCFDMNFGASLVQAPNTKVLYVGEQFQEGMLPPGFIPFSILLPPYQALEAEINGEMGLYQQIYTTHLSTTCLDAINTIIIALWAGANIVLVVENGNNLNHMNFLLEYFKNVYGISAATPQTPFMFNPAFNIPIASTLYMMGFITVSEFLKEIPDANVLVQLNSINYFTTILNKVALELFNCYPPINDLIVLVNQYINIVKSGGIQLITFNS